MSVIAEATLSWRNSLKAQQTAFEAEFLKNRKPLIFIKKLSNCIDALLKDIWRAYEMDPQICLIAVGGYGRNALSPFSDIDLLLLTPNALSDAQNQKIITFVSTLWDIGFNVGHSVRNIDECIIEAKNDVTVMTNLIESRLIVGNKDQYQNFYQQIHNTIEPKLFIEQKLLEQTNRHAKFNDTAYNLEPNIKESPGGLRDLHMILWIARSLNLGSHWSELVKTSIITSKEYRQILRHERYLQNLRIRLHYLAKRREDRLLFDFQNELATSMGFCTNYKMRASEQLMKRYYQSVRFITLMNEMLIKTFQTRVLASLEAKRINQYFSVQNGLLIANRAKLFQTMPATIFQSFLLMQQHAEIKGLSATLIKDLQRVKKTINQDFRQSPENKQLFLDILSEKDGVNRVLRMMNKYGVLGQYIPAFGKIIGQMQHDLFHVYTVDEHILHVVCNLRRFAKPELKHEFPICSKLFETFDKPYLLYIAALFHDIAKGRGGDHSELGTIDARRFCKLHGLPKEDVELVAWLVKSHLKMSSTAQKTDLSDPDVINQFSRFVKNEYRLTALYLLTVADIRGTSPNVWNAWKAKLLESLYFQTLNIIKTKETTMTAQIERRKEKATAKLKSFDIKSDFTNELWAYLGEEYFIKFDSDEIAWQSRLLTPHIKSKKPIVRTRLSPDGDGIQVMIYVKDKSDLFARICQFFDSMQYNIAHAQIYTTKDGYALDNFIILEQSTRQVSYSGLLSFIEKTLTENLIKDVAIDAPQQGRISRQVKHMPIKTTITLTEDDNSQFYQLEIIANDRPGILATIAQKLLVLDIQIHNAKINTLGNRVEDNFIISDKHKKSLSLEKIESIISSLSHI